MTSVQAPKTLGPNLAELTIREQAAAAWAKESAEDRRKAERSALTLAHTIFGNSTVVEFDDFIPASFARSRGFTPAHLVSFEVEGLEFNYSAAYEGRRQHVPAGFWLIDRCPTCDDGVRLLARIKNLNDLGRAWATKDFDKVKCFNCQDDADES